MRLFKVSLCCFALGLSPSVQAKSVYRAAVTPTHHLSDNTIVSFSSSLNEARKRFTEAVRKVPHYSQESSIEPSSFLWSHIKQDDNKTLLIWSSGLHGAEFYAGDALQNLILQKLHQGAWSHVDHLFLHGINQTGSRKLQRTNHNNIDLNRNYGDPDTFAIENPHYQEVQILLAPSRPASASLFAQLQFYFQILTKVILNGRRSLVLSVTGQFHHPQGTNYGGTAASEETKRVKSLILEKSKGYQTVLHIDFHTGLGKRGDLQIITDPSTMTSFWKEVYKGTELVTVSDRDFYKAHGSIDEWVVKNLPAKRKLSLTYEYGTLDSHTTMGGLKSLWTLRLENQVRHHGAVDEKTSSLSKKSFEEMFNPQETQWQRSVLEQSLNNFSLILEKLKDQEVPQLEPTQ